MRLELPALFACALLVAAPAAADDPAPATSYDTQPGDDALPATSFDAPPPKKAFKLPRVTFGNGTANSITVEGATREGATFRFREVRIDGNGWLVMHPYRGDDPDLEIHVGHSYLASGTRSNVEVTVEPEPNAGDMYLVMLHRDVNENQKFDFSLVGERDVTDKALAEGTMIIAVPVSAP